MTYPAGDSTSVNQWGPTAPASDFANPPTGIPAEAPTAPQSPRGALSADAPPPQFDTGEMITQQFLSGIGENIPPQGTPVANVQPHIAGVPDSQIAWNNATPGNGTAGNKFS